MKTVRSKDGTTIAYDRTGDGPPVILVDGALCSRAFGPMPKLVPLLARGLGIKKLTLYEPPFIANGHGHQPPADSQGHLQRLISDNRRGDAVKFFMTKMVGAPAFVAIIMPLTPVWKKLKAAAHTLPYDATVMGDFTVPKENVSSVPAPTLVMDGGKSPARLRLAVENVTNAVPGAQRVTLKGQTHNVAMKVLAPVVEEFFTCN